MKKIVIDPGHTEYENKGVLSGYFEGNISFLVGKLLKTELEMRGYEVKMTRNDIKDNPSLSERAQMSAGAWLFLSLHTDWASGGNKVLIFDDINPRNANKELAEDIASAVAESWKTHYIIRYNKLDGSQFGSWQLNPIQGAKNHFCVQRECLAQYDYLLEMANHRDIEACQEFIKPEKQKDIAVRIAHAIAEYDRLHDPSAEYKEKPKIELNSKYKVVVGAYAQKINAEKKIKELREHGFEAWISTKE